MGIYLRRPNHMSLTGIVPRIAAVETSPLGETRHLMLRHDHCGLCAIASDAKFKFCDLPCSLKVRVAAEKLPGPFARRKSIHPEVVLCPGPIWRWHMDLTRQLAAQPATTVRAPASHQLPSSGIVRNLKPPGIPRRQVSFQSERVGQCGAEARKRVEECARASRQ